MTDEELKKLVARFYELLSAQRTIKITPSDVAGTILFDKDGADIKALFATDKHFDTLLATSAVMLDVDGRELTLILGPGEENPLTVYVAQIPGKSNGESMTLFIPADDNLNAKTLKNYLYHYLTDGDFKKEAISGNENYVFIPKG